jgi:hypothetical protein
MSRAATLVRSLLIVLLFAQSFAVGAMEARAALVADAAAKTTPSADADLPPCHRAAAADEPAPAADCCSHGACRCLGLMLALPQIDLPSPRAEAPSDILAETVLSRLPPLRPERPLRPPSA